MFLGREQPRNERERESEKTHSRRRCCNCLTPRPTPDSTRPVVVYLERHVHTSYSLSATASSRCSLARSYPGPIPAAIASTEEKKRTEGRIASIPATRGFHDNISRTARRESPGETGRFADGGRCRARRRRVLRAFRREAPPDGYSALIRAFVRSNLAISH